MKKITIIGLVLVLVICFISIDEDKLSEAILIEDKPIEGDTIETLLEKISIDCKRVDILMHEQKIRINAIQSSIDKYCDGVVDAIEVIED